VKNKNERSGRRKGGIACSTISSLCARERKEERERDGEGEREREREREIERERR
jgi:hypothetical protein